MKADFITYKVKKIPRLVRGLPFMEAKEKVLGKKYDLSLVFIGSARSRTLNRLYRGKDNPTNVLSFPLDENSGEIFIDLKRAEQEAPKFEMSFEKFVLYLFIHGVLHLSGLQHGSTMDRKEHNLLNSFKINGKAHKSGHRHRNLTDKSGNR